MPEIKRFSTPDPSDGDPLPFILEVVVLRRQRQSDEDGGQLVETRERQERWFGARPEVSGGVLLQVETMGGLRAGRKNARGTDALMDFYDAALLPFPRTVNLEGEDRDLLGAAAFRQLREDPDQFVELDTLIDVGAWLYGLYTSDRPTTPPGS